MLAYLDFIFKINDWSAYVTQLQRLTMLLWLGVNFVILQQSLFLTFCMVMVLVMNIYCIAKEVVQISQQVQLMHVLINLVCVTLAVRCAWICSDVDLQDH